MLLFQRVGIGARTVELLYEFFLAIDVDNSGEISLSEFFNFFRMKDTAFARRAFSVMDEDGSGEIDFGEFTITLYNFCSFTKEGLTRFAFELYDADGSGTIDMDEAMGILKEMFGRKYKTNATANKIAKQMESFDWRQNSGMYESGQGELQITYIGFSEFVKKHPGLLYPAFNIQMQLQQNILGSGFWLDEARRQTKIKTMQDNVAKKVMQAGGDFSSNEYMVVQSNSEDHEFFEQMLSMSAKDAINDVNIGTGGKEMVQLDEVLAEGEVRKIQDSTTHKRNKLSKYRKSKRKGGSERKSKLSQEEKREKKKDELKKKFKQQLKKDRKRAMKKERQLYDDRKSIANIFGFKSNKSKASGDSFPENDPRRKLTLMKRDRVKSKAQKGIINVNSKNRNKILAGERKALPWICPTCKRSNYPDLQRCKTCHSLPKYNSKP